MCNVSHLQRVESKDSPKMCENDVAGYPTLPNLHCSNTKIAPSSFVCPPCAFLDSGQQRGMVLLRSWMVSWVISIQIWTRASWRPKHNVAEMLNWIDRGGQSVVSISSTSRNCLHILTTWAGHYCAPGGNQNPLHQHRLWQQAQGSHPNT